MSGSSSRRYLFILGAAAFALAAIFIFAITRPSEPPPVSLAAAGSGPVAVPNAPSRAATPGAGSAARTTYVADVQAVLAARCVQCHGAGDRIVLLSYPQVRPWAKAAANVVQSDARFQAHLGKKSAPPLAATEINAIRNWVSQGSARGRATPTPSGLPIS